MGYKQVTIRHLAEELNLNQSTICRALKSSPKVGRQTVESVQRYAQLRGYNVNWRNHDDSNAEGWNPGVNKKPRDKTKVTIYDIAKHLSISPATVSRALNDWPKIRKKTAEAVKETAKEMGYTPNLHAKGLRTKIGHQTIPGCSSHITVHTIAKQLKLSASTVSRALLNDHRVSDETKSHVIVFANEKGYIPSETARNLKSGQYFLTGTKIQEANWGLVLLRLTK